MPPTPVGTFCCSLNLTSEGLVLQPAGPVFRHDVGLLAAFGNLGGILMPWLVGVTSDWSSLRLGLATSTVCPLLMAFVLLWMQRQPVADFRDGHAVAQDA